MQGDRKQAAKADSRSVDFHFQVNRLGPPGSTVEPVEVFKPDLQCAPNFCRVWDSASPGQAPLNCLEEGLGIEAGGVYSRAQGDDFSGHLGQVAGGNKGLAKNVPEEILQLFQLLLAHLEAFSL